MQAAAAAEVTNIYRRMRPALPFLFDLHLRQMRLIRFSAGDAMLTLFTLSASFD